MVLKNLTWKRDPHIPYSFAALAQLVRMKPLKWLLSLQTTANPNLKVGENEKLPRGGTDFMASDPNAKLNSPVRRL
jgi:hypothetical protein